MKAILILLDSLNRRYLPFYGGEADTPNLQRLAQRGVIFDNHWCGSAPCMPARRDIMTGRLNFLERPWGGIEPFDITLPKKLAQANVHSHMCTDHYLYSTVGGENYCNSFTTWDLIRGQEFDPWAIKPDNGGIARKVLKTSGYKGIYSQEYLLNRELSVSADDYPTPKTLSKAAEWLDECAEADNFFMWVEAFDPHEPFDVPKEFYKPCKEYSNEYYWPEYAPCKEHSEEDISQIRDRYKAILRMTDYYVGKIIDVMDRRNMWNDTMLILTTDHGYMLGEHGYMAKNYMPAYNEVFHIPLVICHPSAKPNRVSSLTQNIDLMPTLLELFHVSSAGLNMHGKSMLPLLEGGKYNSRNAVLYGYFGKSVNIFDGCHTYFKTAVENSNNPLNVYAAMPTILRQYLGYDSIDEQDFEKIETGSFLEWTKFPVFKIPSEIIKFNNPSQEFSTRSKYCDKDLLYNILDDYSQNNPVENRNIEEQMKQKLVQVMLEHQAPKEQYTRLGLEI